MSIIDNNKQLSSNEERDILDIMTSPDEQAKIDLLKLRVLVERNNDVERSVLQAFRVDKTLTSKTEQLRSLLFKSAVRGNGALREYEQRLTKTYTHLSANNWHVSDRECIAILQAGMITCEDIKCSDELDLLKGRRGERTATHKTKYAVDAALGPNTFNKMIEQVKSAGYEGKTIGNMTEMLHILLDSMIQTIKPFAQGKEVIPPGTKLKPKAPAPTPKQPTNPKQTPSQPKAPAPTPKQPTNPKQTPSQPSPGNGNSTPKTGPGSAPSQPEAPTQPNTPKNPSQPKTPNQPKQDGDGKNTPKTGPGSAPSQPEAPDQSTDQCDEFGNTIKQITTIDELPTSRTDDVVYYLTIGTTQYIFYKNQRAANVEQKKMLNRSKDVNGILTLDGKAINPPLQNPPSPGAAVQDSLPPQTSTPSQPIIDITPIAPRPQATLTPAQERQKRENERIDMIREGKVEPWALEKAKVEIDESQISYTELAHTINSIHDTSLRKEMIKRSLVDSKEKDTSGKAISKARRMQELFGMKARDLNTDNFYHANTMQGKLNKISLKRFTRPNRVWWNKEQIERSHIPNDVKVIYEKFRSGELLTNDLPYCIISKTNGCIYLFTADHRLVASQPVLLGETKGDTPWGKNAHINTTPPGRYQIASKKQYTGSEYASDYGPGHFSILAPLDRQYYVRPDQTKQLMDLRIHPTVHPDQREPLLKDGVPLEQRRVSNGCVNISRQSYDEFFDHIAYSSRTNQGSMVYITPEDQSSPAVA